MTTGYCAYCVRINIYIYFFHLTPSSLPLVGFHSFTISLTRVLLSSVLVSWDTVLNWLVVFSLLIALAITFSWWGSLLWLLHLNGAVIDIHLEQSHNLTFKQDLSRIMWGRYSSPEKLVTYSLVGNFLV